MRLIDCAPLLPLLPEIFPTWPCEVSEARHEAPCASIITIRRESGVYGLSAPWLDGPLRSDTEAGLFADLTADLIHAWLAAHPDVLCLHAAAVEFAGRLALFPNMNKAGKSMLATRLMAEGRRCFGDDLVALLPDGTGRAFGVPPRLRLPLPASEPGLAEFVGENGGLGDAHCRHLSARLTALARFGETRPLGAVIMLARRTRGPAELIPADLGESLRNLVYQHFMRPGGALDVLNASAALIRALPCWHLRYARLDEAAACLREAFLEGEQPGFTAGNAARAPFPAEKKARPGPKRRGTRRRRALAARFVRSPDALLREEAGETFLVRADGNRIFHLNATGRAVWELLAEPCGETEAAALLAAAFPDEDPVRIERDTAALFLKLRKYGLLRAVLSPVTSG